MFLLLGAHFKFFFSAQIGCVEKHINLVSKIFDIQRARILMDTKLHIYSFSLLSLQAQQTSNIAALIDKQNPHFVCLSRTVDAEQAEKYEIHILVHLF